MFRIDKDNNSIEPLEARSFSELGFKERQHLQEWIAKKPSCLGEELLIIQKEFAGFSDTRERLDLLALDKNGCLVIIENKLDNTGRDVTWQAMKYASYCASLKTERICGIFQDYLNSTGESGTASELIAEFLKEEDLSEVTLNPGQSQRIMLIAANFRKEVTSTVLWLWNFNLRVQCFKVTPWSMDKYRFLTVEEIIPVKEARDYMIGVADKAQDEAHKISSKVARQNMLREFWTEVIRVMKNSESKLFDISSPSGTSWLGKGAGMSNAEYTFEVSGRYMRAKISINKGKQADNENVFDKLFAQREALEAAFGGDVPLVWERLDEKKACQIKCETEANVYNREDWQRMIEFMTDAMIRLEKAFHEPLQKLNADKGPDTSKPESAGDGQ